MIAVAVIAFARLAPGAMGRGMVGVSLALVLRHRVVLEDFALEDPDLDAAGAVGGMRGRNAVIDVGAQGVQRHAAFAIPFEASDFRAAKPARAVDADALRAEPHRRLDRALHRPAEGNAALELLGDRIGDQRRIDLGLADLDDVDGDFRAGQLRHLLAQLVDVGALLADDDTGAGRVDVDARLFVRTLDDDLRDRGLLQALHQDVADLHVFVQKLAVLALARVPARIPGAVDAEAQPDRIDLLTHCASPLCRFDVVADFAHDDRDVRERLFDATRPPPRAGAEALHHHVLADPRLGDDQIVDVEIVVVLGIGDRRFERLPDLGRDPLSREFEVGERGRDLLAADELGEKIELLRADAQHADGRFGLVVGKAPRVGFLGHVGYALFAFLSAEWPWNVRVGANSPNLWPIISSDTSTGMCL